MSALLQQRAEDATIKSVVVSQFTSFLTLLETPLRSVSHWCDIVYFMSDGCMSRGSQYIVLWY